MFEKLLANLPYNPALAKQIGFYARRMRREETIRRTGLAFIVLAFMVQFFAFISPPQQTSAYSSSDMIDGGFTQQSQAVSACRNDVKNYGDALWNFGISCDAVANAQVTTIVPTQDNNQLFSMGWLSYGQNNPVTGKATDEQSYNLVKVSETLYAQRHSSFYGGGNQDKQYQALKGTSSTGQTFWLLFGCGNLVFVGVPVPIKPCPYNSTSLTGASDCIKPSPPVVVPPTPTPPTKTPQPCPYDSSILKSSSQCVVCPSNSTITVSNNRCVPCSYNSTIAKSSNQCIPCPYNSAIAKTNSQCKSCTAALSSENATACIVPDKSGKDVTQNKNANGLTAQANDVIVYTLFAHNRGNATVKGYVMEDNLSDVLVYAEAIDLNGGKIDRNNEVTWPATDIKAGSTLTHQITIRVRNPIPTTMPAADDPNHFDHIMTNTYGDTINTNLPMPVGATTLAATTTSLPNTGPGNSLIIAGAILVVAGYFFARSRLLVNESIIAIQETSGGKL